LSQCRTRGCHTRGARGGSDLNRTLGERPATASLHSATPKEKTPLAFLIWGGEISFEKGKGVFLSGFCPPSIRAVWRGEMQFGRGKAKLFLREEKDLLCLGYFFRTAGILYSPRRKVREECAADSFLIFGRGVAKRKNLFESKLLLHDYSK
jgi:hypothetical protein